VLKVSRIVVDVAKKSIGVYVNLTDVIPPEWTSMYSEVIIGKILGIHSIPTVSASPSQ
jgi:hypothetical protein